MEYILGDDNKKKALIEEEEEQNKIQEQAIKQDKIKDQALKEKENLELEKKLLISKLRFRRMIIGIIKTAIFILFMIF